MIETNRAPLDMQAGSRAGLDAFRVASSREIVAMLRGLSNGSVPVELRGTHQGQVCTTTIWCLDPGRGMLGFRADTSDRQLQSLLDHGAALAVAHPNNVKVQFEAMNLVLVRGDHVDVLSCDVPSEMFRFQRRHAYRVRPPMRSAPSARLFHPARVETELMLRVIDVSIDGCALFLPDDVPALLPGVLLDRVEIDLDADTRFQASLRLRHVTAINTEARGVRLGFAFERVGGDALRSLQRFIDQTQKRGRLLALA